MLYNFVLISLIIFIIISLVKCVHFIYEIVWVLYNGNHFANNIEEAFDESNYEKITEIIYEVRKRSQPIVCCLRKLANKNCDTTIIYKIRKNIINFFVDYVYNMPLLIIIVSSLGYLMGSGHVVTLAGVVVLFCVLTQVIYYIISRITMGFADNFYQYFPRFPGDINLSQLKFRHLLKEFLLKFLIIFISFVYGTGFVHFSTEITFSKQNNLNFNSKPDDYHFNEDIDISIIDTTSNKTVLCLPQFINTVITFTYFSFVTITTTGFGDIYPISLYARLVTILEIFINLMFIVVLLFNVSLTIEWKKTKIIE